MFRSLRRLYDWVLSWAETPYGALALAVLAFAEASFFPIPPDVLLIALCIGQRSRAMWFAGVCAFASLFGGAAGYLIGWGFWEATQHIFYAYIPGFTEDQFLYVRDLYERHDFWIVFMAAFTPIPYKVITITAGVCSINFPMFMLASVVGRSARFFLVATLIYFFGKPIRGFIEKRFNTLTVVFVILLIGGFFALKQFGHDDPPVPVSGEAPISVTAPEEAPVPDEHGESVDAPPGPLSSQDVGETSAMPASAGLGEPEERPLSTVP